VAQVGQVQLVAEISGELTDSRGLADETLAWPLQPVTIEGHLPPVHGGLSKRGSQSSNSCQSSHSSGSMRGDFRFLPSVGTWLLPLPFVQDSQEQTSTPAQRGDEKEDLQFTNLKAELWSGSLDSWIPCKVSLYHDRFLVKASYSLVASEEILCQYWLSELSAFHVECEILSFTAPDSQVHLRCPAHADRVGAAIQEAAQRLTCQLRHRKWGVVNLNVYDLFNWQMSIVNNVTWMLGAGGAYHAGLDVYDVEYAFGGSEHGISGSGITTCNPRSCHKHSFRESVCLGVTMLTEKEAQAVIRGMAPDWSCEDYEVLGPNCITFCRCLCERLGVESVPEWVDSMVKSIKERHILFDPVRDAPGRKRQHCPEKHPCRLQAQGFLAGLLEVVECGACQTDIQPRAEHWHCEQCAMDFCVNCLSHPAS